MTSELAIDFSPLSYIYTIFEYCMLDFLWHSLLSVCHNLRVEFDSTRIECSREKSKHVTFSVCRIKLQKLRNRRGQCKGLKCLL
jgi:hypothetical protein